MSTQREVLQQALEQVQVFKRCWWLVPAFGNKVNKATREAITNAHSPIFELEHALRAALAEQKCPCGDRPAEQCLGEWEPGCDMGSNPKYAKVAEHTPQQKVQEPVAWAYQWKQGNPISWYVTVARWPESDIWHEYPLYTAPQQAEPVQKPKRTVTYVCPVCAASLERKE